MSRQRLSPRDWFVPIAVLYFGAVTGMLFGSLLGQSNIVISALDHDIDRVFFYWRQFTFDQVRHGYLPLWNPYIFGGTPALANFQCALLYPPNWLHLLLPTAQAINVIVALHLMLVGLFTSMWCRRRGSGIIGSLLGGTLFMFSGPLAMRVYGGHLTLICVVAWSPLIFLCVDDIIDDFGRGKSWLVGAGAVAMQSVGGYPHLAYITAFSVLVYAALRLLAAGNRSRALAVGRIVGMFLLGGALAAAQVVPGIAEGREIVRAASMPFDFATSYSLPPENLLTLVAPRVFGDNFAAPCFGRWGIVETSLFLGSVGVMLAGIGAVHASSLRDRAILITLVLAVLLAMGRYTPLYQLGLAVMPGMDHFRVPARFALIVALLASAIAASGFDLILQSKTSRLVRWVAIAALLGGVLAVIGLLARHSATAGIDGFWGRVIAGLVRTGQSWMKLDLSNPDLRDIESSARLAAQQLLIAAGSFGQIAVILFLSARARPWAYLLPLVAFGQLWLGSEHAWATCRPLDSAPPAWRVALEQRSGDQRVLTVGTSAQNLPMVLGGENIGGYDPSVSSRWANLFCTLTGDEPLNGDFKVYQLSPSPIWSMLRLGVTLPSGDRLSPAPMPQINLVGDFVVVPGPQASLAAVLKPDFDPSRMVVLETDPSLAPPGGSQAAQPVGEAHLLSSSTDQLEISATLDRDAVLLVTDAYSSGWRARAIEPGPQTLYQVLPADHVLRGIPLRAGKHHLVLEYRPTSIMIGLVISTLAITVYVIFWLVVLVRARQTGPVLPDVAA